MYSDDWTQAADDIGEPQPHAATSGGDLFEGDLFGDELIDIYNSAVSPNFQYTMSSLLHPGDSDVKDENKELLTDDGLGAFRASTSFNDLHGLLDEANANKVDASLTEKKTKRKSTAGSAYPRKKSALTPRKKSPNKKQAAALVQASPPRPNCVSSANGMPVATFKSDANTPNPLIKATGEPVHSSKVAPSIPKLTLTARNVTIDKDASTSAPVEVTLTTAAVSDSNDGADYKSLAQAAVSNLISNVNPKADEAATLITTKRVDPNVDTSTAHIKALTGNNWVSACAGAATAVSMATTSDALKESSKCKEEGNRNATHRQNLTVDERARQNRDRNREHARNTRLRKKAYVDELKRTLIEIVAQRDAAELEKRQSIQRELEQREVRFRVMDEFLKLRGRNESSTSRWSAILEDSFIFTIPATSYRQTVRTKNSHFLATEQVLGSIEDIKADARHLNAYLQMMGNKSSAVSLEYVCDRRDFFMDGCCAFLQWEATPVGTEKQNVPIFKGTFRAKFSPASNKLLSASISFDTGCFLAQITEFLATNRAVEDDSAAAQAAASQAGAILDSLQMPHLSASTCINGADVVPNSSSSMSEASEKGDDSSDESLADSNDKAQDASEVTTRRSQRHHA